MKNLLSLSLSLFLLLTTTVRAEQYPDSITPPADEKPMLVATAIGVQIYECRQNDSGNLVWIFKEPRATLYADGQQIGSHYIGPTWEHVDGSKVTGTVTGKWTPPQSTDIPWLRLKATSTGHGGTFSNVTTILRVHTDGGALVGACDSAGMISEQPYKAMYVFYVKRASFEN